MIRRLGRRRLWLMAVMGWQILALGTAALVWLLHDGSDLSCPVPGTDSDYGEWSWSWFPLGHECTFTVERNGFDDFQPAGWGLTIWIALLVIAGLGLLVTRRRALAAP